MPRKTQTTLEGLRLALHGVTCAFFCEGIIAADEPLTLVFKDRSKFTLVRGKHRFHLGKELQPLLRKCKPAPFGDGPKTRYDRTVRDALQLKAENGGFAVENFDPQSAGILQAIQQELLPHDQHPISAELYSLNVYTEGGHFAPHKDTPRGKDMFGTLVVCLPSQFYAGRLVLNHRGVVQKFDWGREIDAQKNPNQLHWAAFFGDVDHQIEQVRGGARVTLTYLLRSGQSESPPRGPAHDEVAPLVEEAWRELLADQKFLPNGGTLAYPCCHLYHQDARFQHETCAITQRSVGLLKGRDHLAAATALQAGLEVSFNPYMFEDCADETWQLDRFPTQAEAKRLRKQMDSEKMAKLLPIRASSEGKKGGFGVTWLEPPPSSDRTSRRFDENDAVELPAAAHLHSCEYCPWGYFGNEGSDVDLYTYAALHIDIPPRGEGVRAANKRSKKAPVKGKRSSRSRKVNDD